MDCEYKKKMKILYARAVVVVYLVSFVLVNVGFYSPVWYTSHVEDNETTVCAELGLVSGHCKYPYFNLDKTHCQASVAVLILFGTIRAEVCLGSQVGNAAIITTIGGALMLVCASYVKTYLYYLVQHG